MVSTHYLALKTLAQTEEGFLNACTEFDDQTHRPTYRLIFGVPGDSAALETAERLGLDSGTLDRARVIYEQTDHRAEQLLQSLNRQKREMVKDQEALQQKMEETHRLLEEQKTLTENLKEEERDFIKTKAKKVQAFVRDSKREIKKLMDSLRETRDVSQLRKAEKQIHQLAQVPLSALSPQEAGWEVPADQLKSGDRVRVENYNAFGTLLEDPEGKTKVRIQLGNLETTVGIQTLKGSRDPAPSKNSQGETGNTNPDGSSRPLPKPHATFGEKAWTKRKRKWRYFSAAPSSTNWESDYHSRSRHGQTETDGAGHAGCLRHRQKPSPRRTARRRRRSDGGGALNESFNSNHFKPHLCEDSIMKRMIPTGFISLGNTFYFSGFFPMPVEKRRLHFTANR